MNKIGDNIRLLRRARGATQEELAEAVHVSFQAVSKWENGGAPDIEMLPALASFFGVSIDELMGFKLNALTNKERFVKFMADTGALKRGSFNLHGYQSEYYVDSERFTTNAQYARLGEYFADSIRESGVVIVDDLINSGKTLLERIERLKAQADITIAAVAVIVERYETQMKEYHPDGPDMIREKYGARILSVVNGDDISRAIAAGIV